MNSEMLENEYPKEVQKYARTFFENDDFLKMIVDEIIDEQIIFDSICKESFNKFLKGDSIILSSDEFSKIAEMSKIRTAVKSLKEDGLVDTIEDETGEDVVFMTEKGKEHVK